MRRLRRPGRGRCLLAGAFWLAAGTLLATGELGPVLTAEAQDSFLPQRRGMVEELKRRGITKPDVLAAMEQVPRHRFVPDSVRAEAYADQPLSLGAERSVYQPYVVALMTSLLDLKPSDKVLEVGTGSGYHAAVLSRLARDVFSIEIVEPVASRASKLLAGLGYHNVTVRVGDGYRGWPEEAPFDAILLSAAPPHIPKPLLDQLREGGRMVVPVGGFFQDLLVITKTADGLEKRSVIPVRLSPMTGRVQDGQ
jgi:protein-L-isoaspartate(D-aspartate) O-methyltransferase